MNIYVYGTGCGAGDLIDQALPARQVQAFVDEAPAGGSFLGRPVISPEELAERDCDLILVTSRHAEAVLERCLALGIPREKLYFLKNSLALQDRNLRHDLARQVLGPDYPERLRASQRLIRTPLWSRREVLEEPALEGDYVRLKTLEALCRRLGTVPGAVAELGVYRGDFARCLNALLPERTLYLFDTFSGFDPEEARGYGEGFVRAHENTTVRAVLARLPHPEKAVLRPGLFPDSARGLEERFALVSLDVDLEESSYAGLRWFLPRMAPGGYLLLHDYNSPRLPGVRAAVERYEAETGQRLRAVPLCDINGSLVICL